MGDGSTTETKLAAVQEREEAARERFFELDAATRKNAPSWWRPVPREKRLAYERIQNEARAAYANWMRSLDELNEAEHPEGPDLATWTVNSIRADTNADGAAFRADIERLRMRDPNALESTVRYLEADVWTIGSGWTKERILRFLSRNDISEYEDRLRNVVTTVVNDQHDRRELYRYALLARRLMNTELRGELEEIAATPGKAASHAQYVLRLAAARVGAQDSAE